MKQSKQGNKQTILSKKIKVLEAAVKKQKAEISQLKMSGKNTKNSLEEIIALMPGHVYWQDKNNIFLGCNDLQAKHAGLKSRKDIVGKTNYDMPWKEQADSLNKLNLKVMKTGKPHVAEEFAIMANGPRVYLSHKVPLHDKKGNISGILGISFDITERKQAEKELKEAKEAAEVASKAKSEFLAVVSHELRIPLTGILGMAQLLEGDNLTLEQQGQLSDLRNAGDYLLSVVCDILDYAKLEADKAELLLAPLDFRKLIEETATMLASKVKEKKLQLLINYADNAPQLIISDARALRHILLNLIGNAIKFTETGYVWVNVNCEELSKKQAMLVLSVEDSGIGISDDKQAIIFDKFSQADASNTRQYGGTGLGLAITRAYVEQMGGTIKVESIIGKGSIFSCTIPFSLPSSALIKSPWEIYKSNVRVLVIDDTLHGEVLCRHIASSLCELTGSKEALNVLRAAQQRKEPFDVVIVNQQLNDMDALKLTKAIQQQPKILQPMLLLVMEKRSLLSQKAATAAGYFECLAKPTHPTELLISLTAAWQKWVDERKKQKKSIHFPKQIKTQTISDKQQITNAEWVHVLLVEDDPIVQRVHVGMLEICGCIVDIAANGQQALNMSTNKKYHVIFMDIGLPDMTGFEVTKKIRQHEAKQTDEHIPIIGLTGYGDEKRQNKCIVAGMDTTAIKPIKLDEIKQLIQTWAIRKHS